MWSYSSEQIWVFFGARSTIPDEIRHASIIIFLNFIKCNGPSLDTLSSTANKISIRDRNHIKEHAVDLMIRSPEHIQ
ncbi:unnamed protein product [Rotaria sp. Silwood2]|nr:unnamed protein product [Rotaria sp. Silwood2]